MTHNTVLSYILTVAANMAYIILHIFCLSYAITHTCLTPSLSLLMHTAATARDPSTKLFRRHHGQSLHSAHNSSARTSPILSDSSSSFSPGGGGVIRGSEDNIYSKDRKYSFSTLVADRLNSALEAIAALSFQDSAPDTSTSNPICGHEKSMSSSTSPVTLISVKANYPALRSNHGEEVEEEKDIREEGQSEDRPNVSVGEPSTRDNQRSLNQITDGNGSGHHGVDVDNVCVPSDVQVRTPRPSPVARTSTVRCLVVDDSSTSRRMLRRLLTAQNYFVLEATDGSNCINVWERDKEMGESVDVIFMDSIMPLMTGTVPTLLLHMFGSLSM